MALHGLKNFCLKSSPGRKITMILRPRTKSGFTMVELLIALFISTLMIITLSTVFISAIKAGERAKANFSKYQSLRVFFLTLERDLRNALAYEPLPFKGMEDRLEFPGYTLSHGKDGGEKKLLEIGYLLKEGKLIRSEESMKKDFKNKEPASKPVLSGIKAIHFEYPYKQEVGDTIYLPFWIEEPYQGIPKAVKVRIELTSGVRFSKVVSIPQGRLGVLPEGKAA